MKKNLVILSGAGMSAESGISTFRDAGGLWDKYPVMQVASVEGYIRDPELVINFYNERRKQLLSGRRQRLCNGFFYIYHNDIPSLLWARKFFRRTDRPFQVSVFYS